LPGLNQLVALSRTQLGEIAWSQRVGAEHFNLRARRKPAQCAAQFEEGERAGEPSGVNADMGQGRFTTMRVELAAGWCQHIATFYL
jgi:hypothetical protein